MFSIHRVKSFSEIEDLKKKYLDSLRGPQEAWLEEQARARPHVFKEERMHAWSRLDYHHAGDVSRKPPFFLDSSNQADRFGLLFSLCTRYS